MVDGLNKNDWLNTLYMSQESMRIKDNTKSENNSIEQSEEGIGTTIIVSVATVGLIFNLIYGIYYAVDKYKKKQIENSDEFKKLEKDVNAFIKNILDASEYLRKNINKEMYKIDDSYKTIDFSKGVGVSDTKPIINSIITEIQKDKKKGKKIDELKCHYEVFYGLNLEYDRKNDIYNSAYDFCRVISKLLNEFSKQNKDSKFKIYKGEFGSGVHIVKCFSYKL